MLTVSPEPSGLLSLRHLIFADKGITILHVKTPQITVSQHLRGVRGMFGECSEITAGNYSCLGFKVGTGFIASLSS